MLCRKYMGIVHIKGTQFFTIIFCQFKEYAKIVSKRTGLFEEKCILLRLIFEKHKVEKICDSQIFVLIIITNGIITPTGYSILSFH